MAESVYHFNPDKELVASLIGGLQKNQERYGYRSCPCRRASGKIADDRDIVCPCVYRAPDVAEYGSCFCGLYVSAEVANGAKPLVPVPERRPPRS
ncbi:MAG: ferredoxin-thioredoxin reductase catalytic domain-containing protein [Candidatus Margulisiibacteriota bacterium]